VTACPAARTVAVVVLNWNGLSLTRACLASLLAQTWRGVEIHVVDNGSEHDEAGALRAEFGDRIRLHALPVNTGFTGGCNHAMHVVLAEGRCEFVALLNNDAEADPRWLEELVAAAAADPRIGACASRMRLFDRPDWLDGAGVWLLSNGDSAPRGRLQPASAWARPDDVLSACGGAVLLRVAMLREIGTFRADFFANFEDEDLMLRAFVAGWRIRYVPTADVRHHLNATIRRVRDLSFNVRSVRNATWAWAVNLPLVTLLLNLPGFLLSNLAIVCLMPLCGRLGVASAFLRGRWRALGELPAILRERRRLAPFRRVGGFAMWWRQRSFVLEYARLVWLRLRSHRIGVMDTRCGRAR
jgi:GT2 family glycosyltransferase